MPKSFSLVLKSEIKKMPLSNLNRQKNGPFFCLFKFDKGIFFISDFNTKEKLFGIILLQGRTIYLYKRHVFFNVLDMYQPCNEFFSCPPLTIYNNVFVVVG